jgi:origin recognition complex subunit 4
LVKGSAKRASGRLANRSTSYTVGGAVDETEAEHPTKRATNGTATKRAAVPDIDIYDDIEGALSVEPSLRPAQRRSLAASREETASTTDELQEVATTPKRGRGRPKNPPSARSDCKTVVNGHEHKAAGEVDIQDELATEATTSSKRGKATRKPAASARKAAAPRSSARRRAASPVEAQDEDTEEPESNVDVGTPSKPRLTRKPATSTRKKAVLAVEDEPTVATPSRLAKRREPLGDRTMIPETEDELDVRPPPSSRKPKQTPSARRRSNRADNTSNEEDGLDIEGEAKDEDDEEAMDVDGNSVMESILDPTEPSPFNKPTSAQKKAAAPLIYGNVPAGRELDLLKTIVLERIAAKRPSPLVNLDAEYRSVHQIIEQTVTAGEGNSMLLIGARGSGKTTLVNKVLSEVAKDSSGEYHVVRLNGFIHTDDKIALREIWRQLGKEMDIEEDGSGPGKNYADTLTTLLALLSHPSEHTGEYTDQVARAVIFVMDEFDLFAQHPRQTLLYNLFDIAQSRKAPIAVLGLTTRIDVTNSLEKRVKSRFSHRYVHLSLAKTFTAFQEMCKAGLTIEPEHLSVEERGILEGGAKSAQATGTPAKMVKKDAKQDVLAEWNANINVRRYIISSHPYILTTIQKLFASPPFLTQHLAPHFYRTKSIPAVLNTFFLPTATLSADTPFAPTNTLNAPDSKLFLIPNLSTLALSLLIAAARLDIIHDSDTCNFNMAYDEYVTLASKARIQSAAGGMSASGSVSKVWGKDVGRREWENLVELSLIMPVIQGQAGGFGMIRCDVALEEIGAVLSGEKGVDRHLERWCKAL